MKHFKLILDWFKGQFKLEKEKTNRCFFELKELLRTNRLHKVKQVERSQNCTMNDLKSIVRDNYKKADRIKRRRLFVEDRLNLILKIYPNLSREEKDAVIDIVLKYSEDV